MMVLVLLVLVPRKVHKNGQRHKRMPQKTWFYLCGIVSIFVFGGRSFGSGHYVKKLSTAVLWNKFHTRENKIAVFIHASDLRTNLTHQRCQHVRADVWPTACCANFPKMHPQKCFGCEQNLFVSSSFLTCDFLGQMETQCN